MKNLYVAFAISIVFNFNNSIRAQSEIWGLTPSGSNGYGTIYGMPTGSTGISAQYNFTGNPGAGPQYAKLLEATNGKLYGMTNTGGANNVGVLFEYDTLTNVYLRKVDFVSANGANPKGSLMQASNGKLYGMTQLGGANGFGVIFEYDITTNTYTKKVDFTGTTGAAIGREPYGTLIESAPASGKLYGMTRLGGAGNVGVLFEYDYNTNTYTKKVDLTGNAGLAAGSNPFGQLTKANGKFYGLTNLGGANGVGVVFEYDYLLDIYTKKIDLLAATGSNPQGSLLLVGTKLYGMTVVGGTNTPQGGVIFEYDYTLNSYTKLTDLTGGIGAGANPTSELMLGSNGNLFGMTRLGGSTNAGAIFEYNLTGPVYTKKFDLASTAAIGGAPLGSLIQVSTGKIYGLTSLGGNASSGVLFQYNASSNTYVKKVDLNFSSGGGTPNGALMQATNGKLYGLTTVGGTNNIGAIFEYDKTTAIYTKKIDLSTTNGSAPYGSMLQASNGKLYGLTSAGGTGAVGTLFEYDAITNAFIKRVDFTGNAGVNPGGAPYGSLVQYSGNGKLYGLTKQGGANAQGVIFEFDPTTNTYTKKIDMLAANGYSAFGSLVEASGKLYGMTSLGGANSLGVIFEYDPATNTYTKKIDFTGAAGLAIGSQPFGSMVATATTGVLYGMTRTGGANNIGVIFEYNVVTNTYTKKFDMVVGTGSQPLGSLIRAANGNMYGVTNLGGANSTGVLFEYDVATNTYTKKIDFSASTGNLPSYTQLLEVCTKPTTPGAITASSNTLCFSNSGTFNYSITALANATSYTWTVPAGATVTSGGTTTNMAANLSGVAPGTYSYGVAGVNICGTGTLSVANVTVNALPTVSVNSGAICAGAAFTIAPSGASTYTVQGGSLIVSPSSNTSYTVTGTSALGCLSSNTATSSVTVNTLPLVSVNSGSVCSGTPFTITPSIAPTASLSFTISGGSYVVSPTSSTNYSLTGTDVNGCVSSNTAVCSVVVYTLPVISVNSATMCAGKNVTISPSGAGASGSYTVGGIPGAGPFVVSPSSTTNYTVAGTNSLGCVSSNTPVSAVTVYTLPVLSVNNTSMCAGQNATISPSGVGTSGTYTVGGVPGAGPFVVSPSSTTNYTVAGTNSLGCVSSNTPVSAVTVYSLPIISVNSGTLCAGQSFTMIATGAGTGGTYSYQTGTNVVSPPTSSSYTVSGTTANGCVAALPATANLTVYALPSVSVNSGTICLGKTFTITPTGSGAGAVYNVLPGGSFTVSPAVNTTYSVTGTNSLGCATSNTAVASVTIIALPVISSTNGAVCLGSIFTTSVSGASSYSYVSSTGTVTANGSTTLSPPSSTSYSVFGTSPVGCVSSLPSIMNLTVNALPPVSITGATAICEGETTTLTANGANSYNWGTSTNPFLIVSPVSATNYSVLGTDLNNCSSLAVFALTVNPLPTITVISGAICPGNCFTLTPGGASTYTFSGGNSVVCPSVTSNYSVSGTDVLGCVSAQSAVATVSVVNILTVTISGNTSICNGDILSLTANGASTYSWNTGDATNTYTGTPSANTTYTVVGTSGTCSDSAEVAVTVNQLPAVSIVATNTLICAGETATILAQGADSYVWSGSQTGSLIVVSPTITTSYTVTGTDGNNCSNTSTYQQVVDACLGINQLSRNNWQLTVYPNPNAGEFTIETEVAMTVTIVNTLGQTVVTQQLTEGKNPVHLKAEAKGMYFIQIKHAGVNKTIKVVKN